jgi:FixJ family two-component response regulator
MRLLIIDDEPHIRQMMRLTLEAAGYEIDEAPTGEDGLDQFGDGSVYAAVLLDQKMPGLDGLETLKRLRERSPGARVVMVTAFASIELAVDAMKLGASDFVRKPMTPETLRGAVAAAIARGVQPPSGRTATAPERPMPPIETLTLNGFRIERDERGRGSTAEHVFRVTRFADGSEATVIVTIAPEAVGRIERLTRRRLEPQNAFWRTQAERRLSDHLWSTGSPPEGGRLTVDDVEVDDIDLAAAWTLD